MLSSRMAALAVLLPAAGLACAMEAPPGAGATRRGEAPRAGGAAPIGAEAAAGRADLGFRGTVVDVRVERDAASGLPFTYVTARVDEPLKGGAPPGALVTWRILGGALDGRRLTVADAPTFRVGEEAYWLLAAPPTGATPWPMLAGLGAGKWVRRAGGRVASADGAEEEEAALRAALAGGAR